MVPHRRLQRSATHRLVWDFLYKARVQNYYFLLFYILKDFFFQRPHKFLYGNVSWFFSWLLTEVFTPYIFDKLYSASVKTVIFHNCDHCEQIIAGFSCYRHWIFFWWAVWNALLTLTRIRTWSYMRQGHELLYAAAQIGTF